MANDTGSPWLWWDYVSKFSETCKMDDVKFNAECAEPIISGIGARARQRERARGQADELQTFLM